jgi:hypothetical protein
MSSRALIQEKLLVARVGASTLPVVFRSSMALCVELPQALSFACWLEGIQSGSKNSCLGMYIDSNSYRKKLSISGNRPYAKLLDYPELG